MAEVRIENAKNITGQCKCCNQYRFVGKDRLCDICSGRAKSRAQMRRKEAQQKQLKAKREL